MKIPSTIDSFGVTLKHCALVLGVSAALVAASARAATTISTYDLGASGSGTFFAGGELTSWIAQGTLPVGSILREVSIDATLDDNPGGSWASNLNVLVDGVLQIGSDGGTIGWSNGGDSNVGATVIDTKTAGVDFPATIDLNTAGLFLTNTWSGATWSGTVTVTYDVPGVADITSFGLPGNPALINGNQITWSLPAGTDAAALAPTFTLAAGATCDHISGTAYDFSSPLHYIVTSADGLTIKEYTVTALVEASLANITSFGLPGNPALINGNQITWALPSETDVTALAPTFTLAEGATCDHISGTAYDFSSPLHYVVTSADGLTVNDYTVTALVDAPWGMINVNFDAAARTGLVGPAGGAGATWNEQLGTAGLTAGGLLGAVGAATSVGFTCNAQYVYSWGDPTLEMLTGSGFQWEWQTPTELVISGLTTGRKYTLYIASFHPNELGGRSLFSTTNPTTTQGTQIAHNYGPNGNDHAWVRGLNYVRFDNLEADAAKCITITMVGDSGTNQKRAYLSGFQLVEDPPAGEDTYVEWLATFDFSAYTDPDLTPTGDPDGDGITNQVEYAYGLNPALADGFPNGLTRERWDFIEGRQVADLTGNRGRFLNDPDARDLVPNLDDSGSGANSAYRYRGFLTAPVTGSYQFSISGNAEAELWLADGTVKQTLNGLPAAPGNPLAVLTNRYGKLRIASIEEPHSVENFSAPLEFDKYPSQQSRPVELVAGESYYFEVLHKQWTGDHHVAVAWQVPGATRQIIPTGAFSADATQADDHDSDNLPDAWEATHGLNPDDNGLADARDGQYGDWDADGLTNLEEFQLGTNPTLADTDGDGLSDKDERDYYHSNPLNQCSLVTGPLATVNLTTFSNTSVPWQIREDGTVLAYERRGWTDYPFTVLPGEEGVYEVRITGGAEGGSVRGVENLPLSLHLNGALLARQTLRCLTGQNTTIKQLTPWLTAGTYTLRIENHNVRADCKLRLNSITFQRLGGIDANNNRIPDWVEQKLGDENHLTRIPTTSRTSPACIEGITSNFQSLQILKAVTDGNGQPATQPQEALESTNGGFYSNIPLDPAAATALTIRYQYGMLEDTPAITWIPTDLCAQTTLHIRQGDSLRLDAAFPPPGNGHGNGSPTVHFTVTMDGTLLADSQSNTNHISGQPFTATFNTPGEHTLVVKSRNLPPHTVTLHVHQADFGPAFDVQTDNPRTWTLAGVNGMTIEANDDIGWYEITAAGDDTRSFTVDVFETGTSHVIARLPETGDIIARGTLKAFTVSNVSETGDAQLVLIRPDGSRVYRFTIVAENLPANAEVRLAIIIQGATFSNGGGDLTLRPSDFNSNGIADIFIERGDDSMPQICHSATIVLVD